jgi:THO complex subunit 1
MILLDFLLGLTPAAKEKWGSLQAPNRSVQYTFTLGAEDVTFSLLYSMYRYSY